jgi:hypothetical protein
MLPKVYFRAVKFSDSSRSNIAKQGYGSKGVTHQGSKFG